MSVFEVRGGNDRRSMIKRYERKSKHDAIRELVDLVHCSWQQIEQLEGKLAAASDDLHNAIQQAAEKLPAGWVIQLSVEHQGGGIELYDDNGNEVDFPSNHEHLAITVIDAVDAALDAKQGGGGAA